MNILFSISSFTCETSINTAEKETVKILKKTHDVDFFEYGALRKSLKKFIHSLIAIRELQKKKEYHIIHLNSAFDPKALFRDLLCIPMIRLVSGLPIFIKFHGSKPHLLKYPTYRILTRHLLKMVAGVGFLSSDEKSAFKFKFPDYKHFFSIKNSISKTNFPKDEKKDTVFEMLYVGRIVESKGVVDLLEAFQCLDKNKDMILHIVGDGIILKQLKEKYPITSIIFYGHITEEKVDELFHEADIIILPTYHDEGLPNVILKALAYGVPIITTRIRGMKDYLSEKNCIFVDAKSPNQLCSAIEQLYENEDLRRKMSQNNRLVDTFLPEKVAEEYMNIYCEILKTD